MPDPFTRLVNYWHCALALGPTWPDKLAIFWQETKNIRVRLGLDRHHPEQIYTLRTVYGPLHFRDNFGDITNLPNLFCSQVYRIKTLSTPGVIMDVGANIGLAAAWFAWHNPNRPIYCVEPLPGNAAMVRRNCPQAHVTQAAVGFGRERVALQVDPFGVMASNVSRPLTTHPEEFEVIGLDEFAAAHGLNRIALLKIDTEGMELDILAGGARTLQATQQVAMETHGAARHTGVLRCLQQAGFTITAHKFSGETGMVFAAR